MNAITHVGLACWLSFGLIGAARAGIATFDDLSTPPATDSSTGFEFAHGGSLVYQGVTWDPRVTVVGKDYRVDTTTPGPLFGIAHSGRYFITNGADPSGNNGIILTTDQVLLGAWFGQNEFYGYGTGATQVTITALLGATDGPSVVFDIPGPTPPPPGELQQPAAMGFVDTSSAFSGLTGITGYRIDRPDAQFRDTWVADDFRFAPAVPEPSSVFLLGLGLVTLGGSARWGSSRRRRECS